jgi:hypothetical protein
LPEYDLFIIIVDVLGKRYGWTKREIAEQMYWEEVYEFYELASNLNIVDLNDSMKFDFMLHAQSEEALNGWKDLEIPFPDRSWNPKEKKTPKFKKRFSEVNIEKRVKADPEAKKRFDEILKRVQESQS